MLSYHHLRSSFNSKFLDFFLLVYVTEIEKIRFRPISTSTNHTGYPDATNAVGDNHRGYKIKAAKKNKYPFFLIWTAMARVDFSNLYKKKWDCIFVIFSKSWFLKLPVKGMESCETLKVMPK